PFYALKSVLEKRGLPIGRCPPDSEVAVVSSFFLSLLKKPNSGHPVGGLSRALCLQARTLTIMVDASLTALGGVFALSDQDAIPTSIKYFSTPINLDCLGHWKCLLKDTAIPEESKNIVAFELLAATMSLCSVRAFFGNLHTYNIVLYTDNEVTRHILEKMYSPKPALAGLLRAAVQTLASLTLTVFTVQHVSSESNTIADGLCRGRLEGIPEAWEKVEVDVECIPTPAGSFLTNP
ncbi:hypothetical protein FOL47_001712, partial [Perkinsus chesapeaki]